MRAATRVVVAALVLGLASSAGAQEGAQGHLRQAEAAYLDVEFEMVRDHALNALRAGGLDPQQLLRTYELLGVAHSALGETDAARDYFVSMLGLDPEADLDSSVNPQMRDPFLEARGLWAARTGQLGVEVGLDRAASALHVSVEDPTEMVRQVRVATRLEGATEFTRVELDMAPELNAEVAGADEADRVEYSIELLDEHGNVMLAEGSAFSPRVVGRMPSATAEGGSSFFEEPVFWIVVGALAAAAAAVTVGIIVDQRSRVGVQTGVTFGVD